MGRIEELAIAAQAADNSGDAVSQAIALKARVLLKLALQAGNAFDRIMLIEAAEGSLVQAAKFGGN